MVARCPQAAAAEVSGLEEQYWHEFNDFQLQLGRHLEERDTTLTKVGQTVLSCGTTCCCFVKHQPCSAFCRAAQAVTSVGCS